ncbi:hypothetical protein BKA70DRAFT_540340 [Coprinopsis sp. MPI-PUGE-AT-0042]|nr:hypothetical protein BKA70DRAFT_540340 [Coprinopsis sp. MPI-PUGE-AT-0042]
MAPSKSKKKAPGTKKSTKKPGARRGKAPSAPTTRSTRAQTAASSGTVPGAPTPSTSNSTVFHDEDLEETNSDIEAQQFMEELIADGALIRKRVLPAEVNASSDDDDEGEEEESTSSSSGTGEKDSDSDSDDAAEQQKTRKQPGASNKQDKAANSAPKVNIPYSIGFSAPQAKGSKAASAPSRIASLPSDTLWPDFFGQMKIFASDVLFPGKAAIDDAEISITFSIPRRVTTTVLSNEDEYKFMVESAIKGKEGTSVKITITKVLVDGTLNDSDKENADPKAKGKTKKGSKKKNPDDLPGNKAINDNIQKLHDRWICNTRGCPSSYCFITETGDHLRLTHAHLERWAAGMLDGPETASLEAPPNVALFDTGKAGAAVNPLLLARREAMKKSLDMRVPWRRIKLLIFENASSIGLRSAFDE